MASGQNPWDGHQPSHSLLSTSSPGSNGTNGGDNSRASESLQIQKRFFVSSVNIPFIYNGPPPSNGSGSTSQAAAQASGSTRQETSARPALTIATPVTITTSQPTTVIRHVTADQREYLESIFNMRPRPEMDEVGEIAARLSLTVTKVRNWFTNRRAKAKREAGEAPLQLPPSHSIPPRATASAAIALQVQSYPSRTEPSLIEPSPIEPSLIEPSRSEATRNGPTRNVASGALTSIDREGTPTADGVLGSRSGNYRPPTIQARSLSTSKSLLDKAQSKKGDSSNQMTTSQVRGCLFPMLRGGSIAHKGHVPELAKLVVLAGDSLGRKYIINSLSYTKDQTVHDEFAKTEGLARIVEWIKEGRKEIDNMEDPYDGEQQPKEVVHIVTNAIKTLRRAPPEYRHSDYTQLIKQLANDVAYPEEIVRAASELLAEWSRTGDRYSSRSEPSQSLVDGRKRAKMDAGSSASASESISQLPKFVKKSTLAAASNRNTTTSSSTSSSTTSYSSAHAFSPPSAPTAKGGPASRRIDKSSIPLSVLTGRDLPSKPSTVPTSPVSSKAASSPRQPYSPRGPVQSPRTTSSPRTAQGALSPSTSDVVLGRQLDFFSSISAPLNVTSTASPVTSSAPTTPTAPKTPTVSTTTANASTATTASTTSSSGTIAGAAIMPATARSHIVAPSGRLIPSALILRPENRKKKVVRFRGGDDIREVRFFESHPDEHRSEEYSYDDENDGRRDDDRGDRDDRGDNWDDRDNWGGYYDEEDERTRMMDYEDDRDRYYRDDRGYDQGHESGQGYNNGYPEGYEHGRAYSDEQGYERGRDVLHYDHGYEHGRDEYGRYHEYGYEYTHEQEQHHQQQQQQHHYPEQSCPEPTLEPVAHADESAVLAVAAVPAFRFSKEETEKLVCGDLWRPPQKLLIEHPEDKRHMESATFGDESEERMVQAEREVNVPVVEYPHLASVPYSPAEPDGEDEQVDPRPKRKIELYELSAPTHTVVLPMLSMLLQVIQARRKEMES